MTSNRGDPWDRERGRQTWLFFWLCQKNLCKRLRGVLRKKLIEFHLCIVGVFRVDLVQCTDVHEGCLALGRIRPIEYATA
jgi:hypothetical protein